MTAIRTRRAALVLGACLTLLAVPAPGSAEVARHADYALGGTPVISATCDSACPVRVGGYTFAPEGRVPRRVEVADRSSGPVSVTVCQDYDGLRCGGPGEPRVVACAKVVDLRNSEIPFLPDRDTSVFVRAADPTQPSGCLGTAIGGRITLFLA